MKKHLLCLVGQPDHLCDGANSSFHQFLLLDIKLDILIV